MQSGSGHVGDEELAFTDTQPPYINPVSSRAGRGLGQRDAALGLRGNSSCWGDRGPGRPRSKENRRRADTPTRAALPQLLPVPVSSVPLKAEGPQDLCV